MDQIFWQEMQNIRAFEILQSGIRFTREPFVSIVKHKKITSWEEMENATKTQESQSPRLLVISNRSSEIDLLTIVADGRCINCEHADFSRAVITLVMSYTVFSLKFPRPYCQILGFIQQVVMEQDYVGPKSIRYLHTLRRLNL